MELSSADVLDLFAALGLPCSAAAAPAMLLSASSAWAALPPADSPPEAASAAAHARPAAAAGPTVTVVHFVTWLVQQAAVRRQRAQEHSAHSAARHGSLSSLNTWPHSLPSLRTGPAASWCAALSNLQFFYCPYCPLCNEDECAVTLSK